MSDGTLDAEYRMRDTVREEILDLCISNKIEIPVLDSKLNSQDLFKILREINKDKVI